MAYQTIWTPDPMPPQQPQGPYPPQTIYYPTPPISPISKPPKPGKGLSVKRMRKISDDWLKILSEVEDTKNKGKKPDAKKRDGLNWIELSLLLVFISPLVALAEVGGAILLVHLIGK
jgi:hypothetical protein